MLPGIKLVFGLLRFIFYRERSSSRMGDRGKRNQRRYCFAHRTFRYFELCSICLKVHKHEIILNFFLPKSNPYIPLVNFQKKILFFSFDFRQNFEVRTFSRWLSIRGTKFFWRDIQKFFFQNVHLGPIRWVPKLFFKIWILYSRNLHFNVGFLNNFRKL